MKASFNFDEFKKAIKKLEKVNTKGVSLPILENLYLSTGSNSITLSRTNLNTLLEIKIDAEIEEYGKVLIPATTLKIINNIKKGIEVILTDNTIKIDKKEIQFRNVVLEDYPKVTIQADKSQFKITEKELYRMLEVFYATAKDETRPILTGVNIRKNKFTAIDGFRLSIRSSYQFNSNLDITVSADTIETLLTLIDKKSNDYIEVFVNEKEMEVNNKVNIVNTHVRFNSQKFALEGKLLEGEYIRYENIIPEEDGARTIFKLNDKEVIDKIKLMSSLENNVITFNINENGVEFKGKDTENIIKDELEGSVSGESLQVAFNYKYLLDALKQYGECVSMYFTKSIAPMVLTNDYQNLELVLPVRINS